MEVTGLTHSFSVGTDHVKRSENMAVVVTGLEVFGDVSERRQIFWILSRTWDVTDLVLCYDVLQKDRERERLSIIFTDPLCRKTNRIYSSSHFTNHKAIISVVQFHFDGFLESLGWSLSCGNMLCKLKNISVFCVNYKTSKLPKKVFSEVSYQQNTSLLWAKCRKY